MTIADAPCLPEWVVAHAAYGLRTVSIIDEAKRISGSIGPRYYLWATLNCPFDPSHVYRAPEDAQWSTDSLEKAQAAFEHWAERDLLQISAGGAPDA